MEKKENDHPPPIDSASAAAKTKWTGDTKCCAAFVLLVAATMASVGCTVTGCCTK